MGPIQEEQIQERFTALRKVDTGLVVRAPPVRPHVPLIDYGGSAPRHVPQAKLEAKGCLDSTRPEPLQKPPPFRLIQPRRIGSIRRWAKSGLCMCGSRSQKKSQRKHQDQKPSSNR